MTKVYLTTPLYYVNDVPHIGHSYTTIAADVLARWSRMQGKDVHFLTGTDEHGEKIDKASAAAGEKTQEFTDRIAGEYKRMWKALDISYDDFIRTTEERHKKVVQDVFEKLLASGDIYKGTYEDWYCMHDESYFTESELVDKKCPTCGRDVQRLKEESYFFKLSRYEQKLLDYYAAHPEFLSPANRASEIHNFVKSGLKDLSVSRTRVKWGIPVKSNPQHVVYVWFDALLNYVSALQYSPAAAQQPPVFTAAWPAHVHFVGKEIFRFHTVIWPAMLMALGLPLPKKVFAHGWWTVEGTKMSKSLGNVVDPHKMSAEYGVDAFRYFLLREVPFGSDGDFSEKALLTRYNAELANNLGNLVQRTTTLLDKNFAGEIPSAKEPFVLLGDVRDVLAKINSAYDALAFGDVLDSIMDVMFRTNKFIDEKAPWKMGPEQKDALAHVLLECLSVIKALSVLLAPFMPGKTQDIWQRLGETGSVAENAPALIKSLSAGEAPSFKAGQRVVKGDPLFMRKGGKPK